MELSRVQVVVDPPTVQVYYKTLYLHSFCVIPCPLFGYNLSVAIADSVKTAILLSVISDGRKIKYKSIKFVRMFTHFVATLQNFHSRRHLSSMCT